jgi:hypothetical protein
MRIVKLTVIAVLLSLSIGVLAYAHHSFAAVYSTETELEFKDVTIVRVNWANPHTIVAFDARDETGKTTRWVTETGSPSALPRIGWTRTSVSVGDVVTVHVNPARDGSPRGHLVRVRLPDGTVFNRGGETR